MNIYEIYVTTVVTRDPRGGGVTKRFTFPVLVAEANASKALIKCKRAYAPLYRGKHKIKVTYTRPDLIISNE